MKKSTLDFTSKSSIVYYFLLVIILLTLPYSYSNAQANLVVNGDFSMIDPNDPQSPFFDTEYNYSLDNLYDEGYFTIKDNPKGVHNNFCNMNSEEKRSPISKGNMLIGNADKYSSKKLWAQTISVKPNTNYTFSFWAASLAPNSGGASNLLFGLYADCKRMGSNISNASLCDWIKYTIEINTGNLSQVELAIRNLSVEASGNDIAIDDISFVETVSSTPFPALAERVWMGYSNEWFNADNWGSCTLPTCGDNITIPSGVANYPIISAGTSTAYKIANAGSITIEPGASLTMGAYSELFVCGDLNNYGTINGNNQSQITLSGSSDQVIAGNYINLKINKSSGFTSLDGNVTVSGTLTLTKGLIKTGPYELSLSSSSTSAIVSHSSSSYVVGNLRRSIKNTGLVVNPSFEHGNNREENPYGWTTNVISGSGSADFTETYEGAKGGSYHLTHWTNNTTYEIETFQTITGLPNGNYTLKAWVRCDPGQAAYMFARGFNGTTVLQNSPGSVGSWKQISISGINVINGQCIIGFHSAGNSVSHRFYMDDVEFRQEVVSNSGFESGMTNWNTTLSSSGTGNEDYSETYGGSYEKSYHLTHWRNNPYEVATYQTITNLTNGFYTLKAWVKSSGGQTSAYMLASPTHSINSIIKTPNIGNTNNNWVQVTISNIQVTNNSCTIGFYSKAGTNQWLNADQVEFYKEDQVTYDFPVGDASRYQRISMTMTSNLAVSSILGGFNSENATGTAGLPLEEAGYTFDELAEGGYWHLTPDIEPLSSGLYDVEVFLPTIPDANDAVTLAKRHDSSSDWVLENSAAVGDYSPRSSFKRTGFSTFSEYTLVGAGMVKLPVDLTSFSASLTEQNNVKLDWSTEREINSQYFIVERSNDAINFVEIARVNAAGSSSIYIEYSVLDNNPIAGINYYRLKQLDDNGASDYSEIVTITVNKTTQTNGFSLYPNPSSSNSPISLIMDDNTNAEISIYNQFGNAIITGHLLTGYGENSTFDLPKLKPGVYLVLVKTQEQLFQEKLIIK